MEQFNEEFVVNIQNMTKVYKIFDSPGQRLRFHLFNYKCGKDFVALDKVSVNIKRGEAFAIIGKNGSGKSTLLQILAGIISSSNGKMSIKGRIAALLELGSGFDPESTGYENIYMNAAILGLNKEEIEEKIDDIIKFADIGEHLYQPVKTYSSGMYIRLGFSIAINVDADILLIDEALAVGDIFFRQKCYDRLNRLKENGTTIILVTHNMSEVEQFCDRALLLHNGKPIIIGTSQEVVKEYYFINQSGKEANKVLEPDTAQNENRNVSEHSKVIFSNGWELRDNQFYSLENSVEITNNKARFTNVGLFDEKGYAQRVFKQGETGYFLTVIEVLENMEVPLAGIFLYNQMNIIVHGKDTLQYYYKYPNKCKKGDILYFLQSMKLDIAEGEYSFEAAFGGLKYETYERRSYLRQEEINLDMEHICNRSKVGDFTIVLNEVGRPNRLMFHGNCDLPGSVDLIIKEKVKE